MMDTLILSGRNADRFLRMGMSKKPVRFQKWQRVYASLVTIRFRPVYSWLPQSEFAFSFSFSQMPQNTKSFALQQTWRK